MMIKKILSVLLYPMVFAAFVGLGLFAGPYARTAYETFFPEPAYVEGDYSQIRAASNAEIVLFSTSTCPYCKHARAWLAEQGITYRDYVLDESVDGKDLYESLGETGVPVLIVGKRKILGFKPDIYEQSLSLTRQK